MTFIVDVLFPIVSLFDELFLSHFMSSCGHMTRTDPYMYPIPWVTVISPGNTYDLNWNILSGLVCFDCWSSYFLFYLPKISSLPQNDAEF